MFKFLYSLVLLTVFLAVSCVPSDYEELESQGAQFQDNRRSPGSALQSINYIKPRLADRFYVASVMESVFGPRVNARNIDKNYFIAKQSVFGGQCDPYEESRDSNKRIEFRDGQCYSTNWNTSQSLGSTPLREAWRLRACELLIDDERAVDYAYSKAHVSTADVFNYPGANKLYQLFYPNSLLPRPTYEILREGKKEGIASGEELWDMTLLTFCMSPDWQIP